MQFIKTLLVGSLAFVAIILALFVFLVKFQSDSALGKSVKLQIIRFPLLVDLLRLNEPGDRRFTYLSDLEEGIALNVTYTKSAMPVMEVGSWIETMVAETTGNRARVSISPSGNVERKAYTDDDLNAIRKTLAASRSGSPTVQIVYLTIYSKNPSNVGIALHRDTIFIFKTAIRLLSDSEVVQSRIERSTLMHEWGHLLGLTHVDAPDCVMSENVEVYSSRNLQETNIPLVHCFDSRQELEELKQLVR